MLIYAFTFAGAGTAEPSFWNLDIPYAGNVIDRAQTVKSRLTEVRSYRDF